MMRPYFSSGQKYLLGWSSVELWDVSAELYSCTRIGVKELYQGYHFRVFYEDGSRWSVAG